jgi:hypothetical protein
MTFCRLRLGVRLQSRKRRRDEVSPVHRAACLAIALVMMMVFRGAAADSAAVEKIIQQLGSPDPKTRAAARKSLEALGPDTLPQLRKALNHPDLEVRKRIGEAVPALETALLVAPKLVTLKAEKKSARQLLEELAQQTGYKMDIWNDDPRDLHTVDLEKVPFWKAVDEVCRRSNIGPLMGYGDERLRFQKENGFPAHIAYSGPFRFVPTTFQHNRSLTFRRLGEPEKPAERSDTLTLNFTLHAEPKTAMLSMGDPHVLEAIDTEGASLLPPPPPPDDPRLPPFAQRRAMRYGNGYAAVSLQGSLVLGRPAEKARGVKLLRVGLPLTILLEQKPEVVVEKILDVKNKKVVVGTTTFNIDNCELTPEKIYRLKMSVTESGLEPNDYTWMNSLYRRVELVDEKGNKYINQGSGWSHSAPNHVQVTFNYGTGGATLGPPVKMMYQVWKSMPYMAKVELRDLPLP